jgi:hypothetical protein
MTKNVEKNIQPEMSEHLAYQVRLPSFITDEEIGLGDVFKRATSYFGIQPCEGCGSRIDALNHWLAFTHRKPK